MKNFDLKEIKMPDKSSVYTNRKLYRIIFDTSDSADFKNLVHAEKFLAKINKSLDMISLELNQSLAKIFSIYIQLKLYDFKYDYNRKLNDCLEYYLKAYDYKYSNGSFHETFFPFNYFKKTIYNLLPIIKNLSKYAADSRYLNFKYELEIIHATLIRLYENLMDLSKKKPCEWQQGF